MGVMDDIMSATSGRWFKFERPGDAITGKIVGIREQQSREFGTSKPLFWDNGEPQIEVLFMIGTDAREDEDDDGVRTVRVKGWGIQRNALRDACQKAGRPPIVGDMMRAVYVGEDQSKKGGFPAKVYEYTIKLQADESFADRLSRESIEASQAKHDPAQGRGVVPPYVEQAAQAKPFEWPDENTPF